LTFCCGESDTNTVAHIDEGSSISNQPREITAIPTKYPDSILGAAAYIAIVAYPLDWAERDDFLIMFKGWYSKNAKALGYRVKPSAYTALRNREINTAFKKIGKITIEKRFPAVDAVFNPFKVQGPLTEGGVIGKSSQATYLDAWKKTYGCKTNRGNN